MVYYLELILYHTQLNSHESLLKTNTMGRGLYHDTYTMQVECCTISYKLRVKWHSFYFWYETYVWRVLLVNLFKKKLITDICTSDLCPFLKFSNRHSILKSMSFSNAQIGIKTAWKHQLLNLLNFRLSTPFNVLLDFAFKFVFLRGTLLSFSEDEMHVSRTECMPGTLTLCILLI